MNLKSCLEGLRSIQRRNPTRRSGNRQSNRVSVCQLLEDRALLSKVTGIVFEDVRANGVPDTDELRIQSLPVSLWDVGADQQFGTGDDRFSGSTQTTTNGTYSLTVESPGTYVVQLGEQTGAYRFIAAAMNSPILTSATVSAAGFSEPFAAGSSASDTQINGPLAHVGSQQARSRQLQQTWSFLQTHPNYLFNVYGRQEKWLKSTTSGSDNWFFVTPEGDLYRWAGANGQATGDFIASVGRDVYSTPALLHDSVAVIETYSNRAVDLAWELDSQLYFDAASTWYETYGNLNVRWVAGDKNQYGNRWYFLKQDGSLFAWDGAVRKASGTMLGLLSPTYFDDPVLLTNAVRPIVGGDSRGLLREAFGIYDVAPIPASVTNATGVWFAGSPNQFGNNLYFVKGDGRFFAWGGTAGESGRLLGQLPESVHSTPAEFAAAQFYIDSSSFETAAFDLDRLYGLVPRRWYYDNWSGQGEKWIEGTRADGKSQWYFILPNGDFHQVHSWNNVTRSVLSTKLLTLSPAYFRLPQLLHNAPRPIPQPLSLPGAIQLSEENPFASVASVDIELGVSAGTRTFSFDIRSFIDSTDSKTSLEDSLAVYLTRPDDRSQTLLDRGTPGTSLFTLSGAHADFVPGTVRFNGSVVSLDLSSFAAPATAQLVFQMLNTDSDFGTRFLIQPLSNAVDPDGFPPLPFTRRSTSAAIGAALDTIAFIAVTQVQVDLENLRYLPNDSVFRADMTLSNSGNLLARRMAVAFPGLPASVTLRGSSGLTAAGVPYINVTNANPSGGLDQGSRSGPILIEFDNPLNLRFPLQAEVISPGENHAPAWTPVGPLTVSPGATLTVSLNAIDDDGDGVTYSISPAEKMPTTVLLPGGRLVFRPEPDQLGSYTFDVIADDGALSTRQTVTLDVVSDNNPATRISGMVLNTLQQPLAGIPVAIAGFSAVTAADGSFTISLPTLKVPTESFNISIPAGDAFLDPFNTGTQEIPFRRSRFDVTTGDSLLNPRMHPNLVSSFIDAGVVYGNDEIRAAALRTFSDGKLKTSGGNLLPLNDTTTFPGGPLENDNEGRLDPATLFATGDVRANENVALIALHTVFLREHNRLADQINAGNPSLTDEQIYQQARRMVGAIIQHITYNEYVPLLIGSNTLPSYTGYNPSVDPGESELFATAAFRIGHTQLASEMKRLAGDGNTLPGGSLSLRDAFFTPLPIQNDGIEPFLRGLAATPMEEVDAHIIDDVRNLLFGPPGAGGMDLAAMDIQRGRDVGLPGYNQARIDFGLPPVTTFAQITSDVTTQTALQDVYGYVDAIDVWVGGISEDLIPGATTGPLFQAILRDQFLRSRDGDRFYYENGQFTPSELALIRATSVESLIERNAPGVDLPSNPFTTGTQPAGPAPGGTSVAAPVDEFRTIDGTGNNQSNASFGAAGGNVIRNFTNGYADGISKPGGAHRPGAREISNAVNSQTGSVPSASGATSLFVFWGQLLDHDFGLTPGGVSDTLKILGNQQLNPIGNEAYPFVAERMDLLLGHAVFPGVNNVIDRTIYLPAIDVANGVDINLGSDATVTTAAIPGASLFVASSTLLDRQGQAFDGILSITEVPVDLTPAALPSNLFPDLVVTIQPADMVFTTPAPLSLPNRSGWAPGTMMDLWSINPITGLFDKVGTANVSADGSLIETISGGIRNSSWHFFVPPPTLAQNPSTIVRNEDEECEACKATQKINSEVEMHSGTLSEQHRLVEYQSLGAVRGLTLHYDSLRADPRPITHFGFDNVQADPNRRMIAEMTISRGDFTLQVPGFSGGQFGLDGGEHFFALPPGFGTIDAALQADLRSQPSGRYDYSVMVGLRRFTGSIFAGSATTATGTLISINRVNSPFGSGWDLGGWQQIVENPDGSVLLIDGDGSELLFESPTVPGGPYGSPVGHFSTLERLADSTFRHTMKDQTVFQFNSDNLLSLQRDRNGNETRYVYQSGKLVQIIDPVGLATSFVYTGERVTSIIDPASRVTELHYDPAGNLTQIVDPDLSMRTWEYDADHHMTAEVDQRGTREETIYDFAGRVKQSIRKDGTVVQISPIQVQGLFPVTESVVPFPAPVAVAIGAADALFADGNGNVQSTRLDQAGQAIFSVDAVGPQPSVIRNRDNLVIRSNDARGNRTRFTYDDKGNVLSIRDEHSGTPAPVPLFPTPLIATGDGPKSVAIGDLDGDGDFDLVTANSYGNSVSVLFGTGNERFGEPVDYAVGVNPSAAVLGDIDNDGDLDILVANLGKYSSAGTTVSVLLNNGDGTFSAAASASVDKGPQSLVLGDLDGDGNLDVVTANGGTRTNSPEKTVSILMGNGNGTFRPRIDIEVARGPLSVDIGDVNGDNNPDIVTTGGSNVTVLLGSGDGDFGGRRDFSFGLAQYVTLADLDTDGNIDLIIANKAAPFTGVGSGVSVALGNGDGTFGLRSLYGLPNSVRFVTTADVDNDGDIDVVASRGGFGSGRGMSVLTNNGNGVLLNTGNIDIVDPVFVATVDIDRDGTIDLLAANERSDNITLLMGNGDGTFPVKSDVGVGNTPNSLAIGDLDQDGDLDIVTANFYGTGVTVLLGFGDGSFPDRTDYSTGSKPYSVALGDVDNDGDLDVAVANQYGRNVSVLLGNGDGSFAPQVAYSVESGLPRSVALGDLNGDNNVDIVVGNYNLGTASTFLGNGDGTFGPKIDTTNTDNILILVLVDMNNDGLLDLVTPGRVRLGLGDGTFSTSSTLTLGSGSALATGDFNGDGNLDLVSNPGNGGIVAVSFGNGDGTFLSRTDHVIGGGARSIAINDIDGDGNLDIVAGTNDNVSILLGDGQGGFADRADFATRNGIRSIAVGDLDNDGDLDFVTANAYGNTVSPRLNNTINPEGGISVTGGKSFTYDPIFNQPTSSIDELGRQTFFEIDPSNGNTLSITRVVGLLDTQSTETDDVVTVFTYTTAGLVDTVTDPLGRMTDFDYDLLGRLETITLAQGTFDEGIQRFEYDNAGNRTAFTDENGNRTEFEYDALNRLTRTIQPDPDGPAGLLESPITTLEYDAAGNMIRTTDPRNNTTTYEFDPLNRLQKTVDANLDETLFAYDNDGNVILVVDPLGQATQNIYDARHRLVRSIDPDGGETRFRYDSDDNLIQLTDPVNNVTLFAYDARNRLIRETDPLGNTAVFEYDAVDHLVRKTDRNARITEFTYDELDRLTTETWTSAAGVTENFIQYSYDKASNLLSSVDDVSALGFSYDNRDRVLTVDNAGTSGVPNVVISYTHDAVGNVLSVTDTIDGLAGAITSYQFDALNRTIATIQSGTGVSDKRVDLAYNELGQFASINRFSDLAGLQLLVGTSYSYDALNRLIDLRHNNGTSDIAFYKFTYDIDSRLTSLADFDGLTTYDFDNRDQLVGANHEDASNPDESYAFDANGNRIASSLHGNAYVTGPGNRLVSDGTFDYVYDDEGNMIRRTEISTGSIRNFQWDHRNRLIAIIDKEAGGIETQRVEFRYDVFDRRISKSVDTTPADAIDAFFTHYVYDREDVILDFADLDGSGAASAMLDRRYMHGPAIDQIFAQEDSVGSVQWLLTDHLGTTHDLVDNTGVLINHIKFDSFGNVIVESEPSMSTRYLFTGREFDEETGLHYYRARYYDAGTGRFISEDPIRFGGGDANLTRYVANNPMQFGDPKGTVRVNKKTSDAVFLKPEKNNKPIKFSGKSIDTRIDAIFIPTNPDIVYKIGDIFEVASRSGRLVSNFSQTAHGKIMGAVLEHVSMVTVNDDKTITANETLKQINNVLARATGNNEMGYVKSTDFVAFVNMAKIENMAKYKEDSPVIPVSACRG